jgi:predicted anti-sigma-YlaC factor YlaD
MRCDEIQERFIELLYDEPAVVSDDSVLKEHVNSCASCRRELEELRNTRRVLRLWQDEKPLRPLTILRTQKVSHHALGNAWQLVRFGAIAALVLLSILALANTRLTWNERGLSFSTRLFSGGNSSTDYYTKAEVRDILKRSLDDSEARMYETNSLMIQEALEIMEKEQYSYFRLASAKTNQRQNVN